MSRNDPNQASAEDGPDKIRRTLKRRRVLLSAGGAAASLAVAGCSGSDQTGEATTEGEPETEMDTETETEAPETETEAQEEEGPEDVSEEEFESGPVPKVYQSSMSLGGEHRADTLTAKADANFSEFDEAQEIDAYVEGSCCANCADYIPDINGDTFGACAEVSGYIDGADWCTVYEGLPEPEVPEGMEEDELATAEVPEQYRTATSQGHEERDPEDLFTHGEVNLTESVEAIAEGDAQPGQSCGNCADFIPDQNDDTWGACAAVEGYIAVEDWCTAYEPIEGERKMEFGGHEEELPEGVSEEEFENGPVPEQYRTVVSIGDEERNPDDVQAKADVQFSEFDEAKENEAHIEGTCCANCADFIPDKNKDGFGACAEVGGYIGREDWCTVYEELPEPEVPEGMSEDELATAEVPEDYRSATSQGDEERDPENLFTHEEVNLKESVDAIAEGDAMPGKSCGNCADYIPDKNGDGWGACAAVEGYIAVEDWCTAWETLSEEH